MGRMIDSGSVGGTGTSRGVTLRSVALLAVIGVCAIGAAAAAERENEKPKAPASKMGASFDRMKALDGEWTGTAQGGPVTVLYKVTAAGSAVVETLFPGTPHEMVTVYTLDGDDLMLTHYCAAGNAPRMKATSARGANALDFKFAGATNLRSSRDMHMHEMSIEFLDADHVRSEWVSYKDGRKADSVKFDLARKKS